MTNELTLFVDTHFFFLLQAFHFGDFVWCHIRFDLWQVVILCHQHNLIKALALIEICLFGIVFLCLFAFDTSVVFIALFLNFLLFNAFKTFLLNKVIFLDCFELGFAFGFE